MFVPTAICRFTSYCKFCTRLRILYNVVNELQFFCTEVGCVHTHGHRSHHRPQWSLIMVPGVIGRLLSNRCGLPGPSR